MILRTKIHRPATTPDLVCRPRLHQILDDALPCHGILVSAPAGYGKSILVSHWAELRPEPCAWLSLDNSDSDLRSFVEYLVAAVRYAIPDACAETQALLETEDLPPAATLAAILANDLDEIETHFLLVLDDLHRVSEPAVFELLGILLDHAPSRLCLILVTRQDPPLALSRLRGRGQLVEVRLRDLVFDTSEAEALLAQVAGISVGAAALANLESELEGWAAGLRLVLLLLANEPDPDRFLMQLSGGTALIGDYLITEVLAKQPPAIRHWLLRTAILDRFCAPLCDAVCADALNADGDGDEGTMHGRDFMRTLVRDGLFTISLDPQGQWYRYHHLFQRLLRERLARELDPASIAALHSRASHWLESQKLVPEAIEHALAAGDEIAAAEIVERNRSFAVDSEDYAALETWLDRLPDALRRERMGLLMTEAYHATERFELGKLSAILERTEALEADAKSSVEQTFFRGTLSFWNGDGAVSAADFQEVLRAIPENDSWLRAESWITRGVAMHINGHSEDAIEAFKSEIERNVVSQGLVWSRLVAGEMFLRLLRGELPQASRDAARLSEGARKAHSSTHSRYVEAWSAYALGNAALRSFDLDRALENLTFAASQRAILHRGPAIDSLTGIVIACEMLGLPDEADRHLARASEFAAWSNSAENLTIVESCRARVALLRGDLDSAARWQDSFREPLALTPCFVFMENPWINAYRVLARAGDEARLLDASKKLAEMREGFGAIHYTCQQLEIAPIEALVLHRLGRTDEAMKALEESLVEASPGGWIRPYVELGAPMAEMFEGLPEEAAGGTLARLIRAAFSGDSGEGTRAAALSPTLSAVPTRSARIELTNRELDVLDLLGERMRDKEIAEKLHISPETVKTHLKTLYRKLDCRGRRSAVTKAEELGLLR